MVLRLFPVAAVVRFRVDYVDRLFVSRSCVLEVLGEYFFHYALIPVYALRAVHAALRLFGFFVHIISVGRFSGENLSLDSIDFAGAHLRVSFCVRGRDSVEPRWLVGLLTVAWSPQLPS